MQQKVNDFEHEKLLKNKNDALAKLINCLSKTQFSLFKNYLQHDEKLKKYETKNLINLVLKSTKKH